MKRILLTMAMFASISCAVLAQVTSITVETVYTDNGSVAGYPANHSTYRIYANTTNPTDRVSTIYGDSEAPLVLNVGGSGVWNHEFGGPSANDASCVLVGAQPIVGFDSYYTIGYTCYTVSNNTFFTLEDSNQPWIDEVFDAVPYGQGNTFINTTLGGTWFGLPDHANTEAGDDLKVLLAQITTDGGICGVFNLQVTPSYVNSNSPVINQTGLAFGTGDCGTPGCTDASALNFDPAAGFNNGLCLYPCTIEVADVTVSNPTCVNDNDGSLEVSVGGNQGFVGYSVNGGEENTGVTTYGSLVNGSYDILVRDLRFDSDILNPGGIYGTCTATTTVTLETQALFAGDALSSGVSCGGANDGCVAFQTYGGGTGDITYELFTGNTAVLDADGNPIVLTSPSYCGVAGGNYRFRMTDENGCTIFTANTNITEPATFSLLEGFESPASCFNSADGVQVITWGGGSGTISFSTEDDGDYEFTGNDVNFILNDVLPGTYMLYAIDGNGCTSSLEYSLDGGPSIETSMMVISPTCPDAGDGSIGIMATGGTGDLTYSFDGANYSTVSILENLAADVYMAYVQDENACTVAIEVVVEDPAPIAATASATDITCNSLTNGSILVSGTGGTDMLFYSLNGVDFTPSPLFENLAAGEYMVYVQDVNACSFELPEMVMIAEPAALNATATSANITCNGFGNGAITVNATGGTGSFVYSTGGAFSSVNPITGLEADTYTVVVQDENGCTTEVTNLVVTEPSALTITGLSANSIDEDAGGNSAYTVTGGTPNYNYEWTNANNQVVSTTTNLPDLTNASDAGEYTVTITDANGCETTATITITGLYETAMNYNIAVFPNPSNGAFRLTLSGVNGQKTSYTILDEAGRVVLAKELAVITGERIENIDMTNMASGVYTMNVNIANSIETLRLIVQ